MSKLQKASSLRTKTSYTTGFSSREEKTEKPPKGAEIESQTIRTEVEEIENGWILCKNYDGRWKDEKGETHYFYYSEKYYSEENPVEVTIKDKALADKFN